jgi:nucleoside-diphosphate-sugar epimerase
VRRSRAAFFAIDRYANSVSLPVLHGATFVSDEPREGSRCFEFDAIMVVGGGLLANAFADDFALRSDIVIFASGVSNSRERNAAAFTRERCLLEGVLQDNKKIVYFSTCSLFDPELVHSPYVVHKRQMEALVRQASRYAIFRLPQIVGKTANANTLTNFIHAKIVRCERFDVWRYARRNLIDVSDVVLIAKFLLNDEQFENQTANIACPTSTSIIELVETFELVLGREADYSLVEAGAAYELDTELAARIASLVGIRFDDSYAERVMRKYYGN